MPLIKTLRREDTGTPPLTLKQRLEDTPLTWTTPSTGSLYQASGRRKGLFFPCLPSPLNTSISSLALEPTTLGFQLILKASQNIQPCGPISYWSFGLNVHSKPLLDLLQYSLQCKSFNKHTPKPKKQKNPMVSISCWSTTGHRAYPALCLMLSWRKQFHFPAGINWKQLLGQRWDFVSTFPSLC